MAARFSAYQTAHGTYVAAGVLDVGWVAPLVFFGIAAWMRPDPPAVRQIPGLRALVVPAGFAILALVMVLYAATAGVTVVSLALAAGALVCVIARFVVTFRSYLVVLRETEYEATTDALTGLRNRRALIVDLEAPSRESASAAAALRPRWVQGLQRFLWPSGRRRTARAPRRMSAGPVGDAGTAYRLGGDEFCVLLGAGAGNHYASAAVDALSEHGVGFAITASRGRVELPAEAVTLTRRCGSPTSACTATSSAAQGAPATSGRTRSCSWWRSAIRTWATTAGSVAAAAEAVALMLGLGGEALGHLAQAAVLHDIGKIGVPLGCCTSPGRWTRRSSR